MGMCSDARREDRMRAAGMEPDPEGCRRVERLAGPFAARP